MGLRGQTMWLWKGMLVAFILGISTIAQSEPASTARAAASTATAKTAAAAGREDYFVSSDTVIIGCTAGAAAGILVGSVPVVGALMSGIGVPESVTLLVNLTGMGCGVGAVSSAVAIFTAWMLQPQ
jgi:hypothetical protein